MNVDNTRNTESGSTQPRSRRIVSANRRRAKSMGALVVDTQHILRDSPAENGQLLVARASASGLHQRPTILATSGEFKARGPFEDYIDTFGRETLSMAER